MKPINAPERKKAFLNFLLLFVITVVVMLTTVFFSVQVPFKENEKLRKDMDITENERIFLQSFELKMQETTVLIDSLTRAGNIFMVGKDIDNNIKTMTYMVNDSISVKSLCNKIIDNLRTLRADKEQLRNVNNSSADMEAKDRRIQQLESEAKACADRVNDLYIKLSGK